MKFTKERDINLVECGVAYGISAFFVLRQLQDRKNKGQIDQFYMHLYDAWIPTKKYGEISVNILFWSKVSIFCSAGYLTNPAHISSYTSHVINPHL